MQRWFFTLPFVIASLLPPIASAQDPISVALRSAGGQSPLQLALGEQATIYVELPGLAAGDSLDSLATTISYEGALLGTPILHPGTAIPAPLADPLDLLITSDTGFADVAFLTLGTNVADHIQTDGVFLSFEVTAAQVGSGAFHFEFVGATKFNEANPHSPLPVSVFAGADLPFRVVAVPEPATLALCALLAAAVFVQRRSLLAY